MFEFVDSHSVEAIVKVIGIGGAGCNTLGYLPRETLDGVEFIAIDTDPLALGSAKADIKLQISGDFMPADGESLRAMLRGTDMVFIIVAMGGRTGPNIAPIVAEIAREMGCLTVAIVIEPITSEGEHLNIARQGFEALSRQVNALFVTPNDKLHHQVSSPEDAFKAVNDMLYDAVQGIVGLVVTRSGLININIHDVRLVMGEHGRGIVGSGTAAGEDRAEKAVNKALSSPLMTNKDLVCARGILVNITAGLDMTIEEFEIVGDALKKLALENATVVIGTVIDPNRGDELRVTVLATGISADKKPEPSLADSGRKQISHE